MPVEKPDDQERQRDLYDPKRLSVTTPVMRQDGSRIKPGEIEIVQIGIGENGHFYRVDENGDRHLLDVTEFLSINEKFEG